MEKINVILSFHYHTQQILRFSALSTQFRVVVAVYQCTIINVMVSLEEFRLIFIASASGEHVLEY